MEPTKFKANTLKAKQVTINAVLVINAFVWYYFISSLLDTAANNPTFNQSMTALMWLLHFSGIGIAALTGAALTKKIKNRERFLLLWMLTGAILSTVPLIITPTDTLFLLVLSLGFGLSLGIGMPSCMGYFSDNIKIELRGKTAGTIFLLSGVIMALLGTISGNSLTLQTSILTVWRFLGVLVFSLFILFTPNRPTIISKKNAHYRKILTQKSFLLYLIPWILFSLISYLSVPIQRTIITSMQANMMDVPSIDTLRLIENILVAVSAVLSGVLADRVGRKRIAIIGFVMLGLAYAAVGLQPYNTVSWYFYTILDGFALGILYVIFVITIWSDLSSDLPSEKYYAVGVLPFFISFLLRFLTSTEISNAIPGDSMFSFIAVFLFLAVLPLVYAPETLPEKVMKDRDLKSYVERAQKQAQKNTHRNGGKEPNPPPEASEPSQDRNYEEAKELAEKYY